MDKFLQEQFISLMESSGYGLNEPKFKNAIASVETGGESDPYKAKNKSGSSAVGKYQFMWSVWKDKIRQVVGKNNPEEFLNDPNAQEQFMDHYVKNEVEPGIKRIRKQLVPVVDKAITDPQIAALIHFRGEPETKKFFQTGRYSKTTEANLSPKAYLEKFGKVYGMSSDELDIIPDKNTDPIKTIKDEEDVEHILDKIGTWISWMGFIPGFGDAFDLIGAVIWWIRAEQTGNKMYYVDAVLSLISAIPGIGSAIGKTIGAALKPVRRTIGAALKNKTLNIKQIKEAVERSGKKMPDGVWDKLDDAAGKFDKELTNLSTKMQGHPVMKPMAKYVDDVKATYKSLFGIADDVAKGGKALAKGVGKMSVGELASFVTKNSRGVVRKMLGGVTKMITNSSRKFSRTDETYMAIQRLRNSFMSDAVKNGKLIAYVSNFGNDTVKLKQFYASIYKALKNSPGVKGIPTPAIFAKSLEGGSVIQKRVVSHIRSQMMKADSKYFRTAVAEATANNPIFEKMMLANIAKKMNKSFVQNAKDAAGNLLYNRGELRGAYDFLNGKGSLFGKDMLRTLSSNINLFKIYPRLNYMGQDVETLGEYLDLPALTLVGAYIKKYSFLVYEYQFSITPGLGSVMNPDQEETMSPDEERKLEAKKDNIENYQRKIESQLEIARRQMQEKFEKGELENPLK